MKRGLVKSRLALGTLLLLIAVDPALADLGAVSFSSAPATAPLFSLAPAQPQYQPSQQGGLPDPLVRDIADYARKQLPTTALPDGKPVGPETAVEQSQRFLLPFSDLQRIERRGAISGYAALCGLDWENRSYIPFMGGEEHSGRWTDKQLVYIALLHEIAQGAFIHNLHGKQCPADVKANLDRELPQAVSAAPQSPSLSSAPATATATAPTPAKWPHS